MNALLNRKGMTLVEVLVASGISLMVILGTQASLSRSMRSSASIKSTLDFNALVSKLQMVLNNAPSCTNMFSQTVFNPSGFPATVPAIGWTFPVASPISVSPLTSNGLSSGIPIASLGITGNLNIKNLEFSGTVYPYSTNQYIVPFTVTASKEIGAEGAIGNKTLSQTLPVIITVNPTNHLITGCLTSTVATYWQGSSTSPNDISNTNTGSTTIIGSATIKGLLNTTNITNTGNITSGSYSGPISAANVSGSLSNATIPGSNVIAPINATNISGSLSNATIPGGNVIAPINATNISGSLSNATIPGGNVIAPIDATNISGNLSNATIPASNVTGLNTAIQALIPAPAPPSPSQPTIVSTSIVNNGPVTNSPSAQSGIKGGVAGVNCSPGSMVSGVTVNAFPSGGISIQLRCK